MRVALRYFDGCPSWRVAEDRLRQVLEELGSPEVSIVLEGVETLQRAQEVAFRGSPSLGQLRAAGRLTARAGGSGGRSRR